MKKIVLAFTVLFLFLTSSGCSSESTSITVIGGADGPTDIFVSGGINPLFIIGTILVVAIVIGVIVFIKRRK